jgi:hypothetical protein
MKQFGFIPPEIIEDKEYVFGDGQLTGKVIRPDGQWDDFAITDERQTRNGAETCGCVVFSVLNTIEYLIWTLYKEKVNYSDRWIIIKAGVKCPGSDPHKVCEAIRKWGLVNEEDLPFNSEDFYNIPNEAELEAKGQEWLKKYSFGHDCLSKGELISEKTLKQALTFNPLPIGVVGWFQEDDIYIRPRGIKDNHFTALHGYNELKNYSIKDSYEPFDKKLSWHYGFYWAKRIVIEKKPTEVQLSFWQKILELMKKILLLDIEIIKKQSEDIKKNSATNETKPTPPPTPEPVVSKIKAWAEAITKYENMGKYHKDLNNPGAIKGKNGLFLKFNTYEEGFDYLCDYLTRACKGEHNAYRPEMTLKQFTEIYAPSVDKNNPLKYSLWVAEQIGVKIDTQIKDLA